MQMNIKKMVYYITYIYLIFNFIIFINEKITDFIGKIYFFIIIYLLIIFYTKKELKIPIYAFIYFFLLLFGCLVQYIIGQYGCYDILKNTIFVFIAYFICKNDMLSLNNEKKKIDFIYIITCLYLIIFLIISYFNKTLTTNIYYSINSFYLPAIQDKNMSALVIFLFMCFCYSKKYRLGIILSIIYTFFLNSRMAQIGLILFAIIEILVKFRTTNIFLKLFENLNSKSTFIIIILSQLFLIGFSYYCTYNIPISSIDDYKESLIDGSNAMRVRSNVYAVEKIKKNSSFIITGYDGKLKEAIGVANINSSVKYLGFRLVQPHSLLLNLILRYGLLYSIVYLMFISYLISKYWSKNSFSCLVVYLFMNMIIHSLFSSSYLIFIIFVLGSLNIKKKTISD